MILELEEANIREVPIFEEALQSVRADAWNVVLLEEFEPFVGGAGFEFLADHGVERVDVGGARGDVLEARVAFNDLGLADGFEEASPLSIVVRQHGDEAVLGGVGAAML